MNACGPIRAVATLSLALFALPALAVDSAMAEHRYFIANGDID
jgi:hypothetical protein